MRTVQIFWRYIAWHYTLAFADIWRISGNYLWFVRNFFSLGLLARTLFSPWKRLTERHGRGTGESWFGAVIINTIMRLVGFLARSFTILVGFAALLATVFAIAVFVLLWLILPAVVIFLFLAGIGFALKGF